MPPGGSRGTLADAAAGAGVAARRAAEREPAQRSLA